jgi:hypothetical protein
MLTANAGRFWLTNSGEQSWGCVSGKPSRCKRSRRPPFENRKVPALSEVEGVGQPQLEVLQKNKKRGPAGPFNLTFGNFGFTAPPPREHVAHKICYTDDKGKQVCQ